MRSKRRRPQHHAARPAARLSDAQLAAEATRRLAWDAAVPPHAVSVKVARGRITLSGELQREQQRIAMLEDVTRLFGVTGVSDHTVIGTA
ncbi:BON domain-containing protein [Paraburkholderia sp. ZP32-5]|uniref:BON domain-containing protein n=1 Tax=Paraburkholderia sp. ZP32-5 TaxID=2883245 RepID=UPI001F3D1C28|nr:BON domain-containing protein [Paraburkholderia sp. ZP32-5]